MRPNDTETYKANHTRSMHKRDLCRPHEARVSMVRDCLESEAGMVYKVVFVMQWPEGRRSETRRFRSLKKARTVARKFVTTNEGAKT